jgi:His/Glu/Gln/Arg/opine family amino acid ABC transporter permease subunit
MADVRERRTRRDWYEEHRRGVDIAAAVAVVAAMLFAFGRLLVGDRSLDLGYMQTVLLGDPTARPPLPSLVEAARISIFATVVAYGSGMGIGFLVGWAKTLKPPPLGTLLEGLTGGPRVLAILLSGVKRFFRRLADFYVETVRGTPLLVQILFMWSVMLVLSPPEWDLGTRSLAAGVLAMTINTGGYQGEIFRGGIQTVQEGQVEAARSIGLSRWGTMRHVVLPQTFRLVTPPLTNEFIALFKASSLLFIIGVEELTFVGKQLGFFNPKIFEIFLLLTAIYLLVTVPLSRAVGSLERRFRIPGLGVEIAPRQAVRRPAMTGGTAASP